MNNRSTAMMECDVPFAEVGGERLSLDIFSPNPRPAVASPALVWIHGGGWESGNKQGGFSDTLGPMLATAGFVFFSIDYRLSDRALFPAQVHDVKTAICWVRTNAGELGIDPDHIGIWGHSAGGHLASLAGTTGNIPELEGTNGTPEISSAVQAVIALSPATDFLEIPAGWSGSEPRRATEKLVGGRLEDRTELVRLANPIAHIRPGMPPFLIIHGADDEIVPVQHAMRLHEALRAAGCDSTLDILPESNHQLASATRGITTADALQTIGEQAITFFDRHLRPRSLLIDKRL